MRNRPAPTLLSPDERARRQRRGFALRRVRAELVTLSRALSVELGLPAEELCDALAEGRSIEELRSLRDVTTWRTRRPELASHLAWTQRDGGLG